MEFKTQTTTIDQVYTHLVHCDDTFTPPLNTRVNLREFSEKIIRSAITFEAWSEELLIGLVCAYMNDSENHQAYINHVSVLHQHIGQGIAHTLLDKCIVHACNLHFREIALEVTDKNEKAIQLYQKLGFCIFSNDGNKIVMKREL